MQEYGSDTDDNILRYILSKIAATEISLAKETADHDVKVEQIVSAPIQLLLENEIPNMLKVKRNLTKAISERDSVTSRFQVLLFYLSLVTVITNGKKGNFLII